MDKRAIEGIRYANIDDWDGFFKKVRDRDEALAEVMELAADRVREEPISAFDPRIGFGRIHAEVYLQPEKRKVLLKVVMRRLRGGDVETDLTLEDAMWMGRSMIYSVKCAMDEVNASVLHTQAVDLGDMFEEHLVAAERFLKEIRESYETYRAAAHEPPDEDREVAG